MAGIEGIIPNPKLKLMQQVREVMRLKHYSIRTERCYCDWIKRYIKLSARFLWGENAQCWIVEPARPWLNCPRSKAK